MFNHNIEKLSNEFEVSPASGYWCPPSAGGAIFRNHSESLYTLGAMAVGSPTRAETKLGMGVGSLFKNY